MKCAVAFGGCKHNCRMTIKKTVAKWMETDFSTILSEHCILLSGLWVLFFENSLCFFGNISLFSFSGLSPFVHQESAEPRTKNA